MLNRLLIHAAQGLLGILDVLRERQIRLQLSQGSSHSEYAIILFHQVHSTTPGEGQTLTLSVSG